MFKVQIITEVVVCPDCGAVYVLETIILVIDLDAARFICSPDGVLVDLHQF